MEECVFTVELRDDLRWHICESSSTRSLASFGLKDDAVHYAHELGCAELKAEVVVVEPRVAKRDRVEA
jgi:hypothetical protein